MKPKGQEMRVSQIACSLCRYTNERGTYSGQEGGDTEYFDDTLEHDSQFLKMSILCYIPLNGRPITLLMMDQYWKTIHYLNIMWCKQPRVVQIHVEHLLVSICLLIPVSILHIAKADGDFLMRLRDCSCVLATQPSTDHQPKPTTTTNNPPAIVKSSLSHHQTSNIKHHTSHINPFSSFALASQYHSTEDVKQARHNILQY